MWAEQYIHFYHLSVTVIRHLRLRSPSNLELSLIKFYFNCKSNLNLIWFSCFSGFIWCFIVERHQTSSLAVHHGSIKHFPAVWKSSCRNVMKIRCNAVRMRQRSCTELSLALWQTAVKWVMGAAGCCSRHPVSLRVNWIRCVQEAPTTTTTTTTTLSIHALLQLIKSPSDIGPKQSHLFTEEDQQSVSEGSSVRFGTGGIKTRVGPCKPIRACSSFSTNPEKVPEYNLFPSKINPYRTTNMVLIWKLKLQRPQKGQTVWSFSVFQVRVVQNALVTLLWKASSG